MAILMKLGMVFVIYACLLTVGIMHHEPWFDEAQAWLLARDSNPVELFQEHLRYEGSPGLWHLILSLLAKSGLPYESMSFLSATLALVGLFLFLRYAPFPVWIKVLFPFSYFILYQYAIVARSYALLSPLLFGLAILYPKRRERPYPYAIMLALLANVSLHGLILAFCFAAVEAVEIIRSWKDIPASRMKQHLLAFALLFLAGVCAAWQIRFPLDHAAVHPRQNYDFIFALTFTSQFLSRALTEQDILSAIVVGISLWHFWKMRMLSLFLAPVLVIGHLLAFVYSSPWHEGILFLLWIFCLWISLTKVPASARWNRNLVLASLGIVLLIQVRWAVIAYRNDYRSTYSAARDVASYIKKEGDPSATIFATGFHSIAILPYFPGNIFTNYKQRYAAAFWDWSRRNTLQEKLELMVLDAPDTIVHGIKTRFNTAAPVLPGYTSTKFEGHIFWKDRIFEEDSYIVYEKL